MKLFFSIYLLFFVLNYNSSYADTQKTKDFLIDRTKATTLLLTPPNIVKKKIKSYFFLLKYLITFDNKIRFENPTISICPILNKKYLKNGRKYREFK